MHFPGEFIGGPYIEITAFPGHHEPQEIKDVLGRFDTFPVDPQFQERILYQGLYDKAVLDQAPAQPVDSSMVNGMDFR
tara:strand:+ start:2148 stop:2381 length:234 start_codon:yes stop_codon:yes gene_type:complete